ncbi:MAG: magnesium transporter CorA family protein [Patescibacteria group bacterium]|jgi:magnesium transporter
MNNNIRDIKHKNSRWIVVNSPSRADIDFLHDNFKINPHDLDDIIAPSQRSKIDKYEKYIFLIFLFPVFNRKTREIESSEVDFLLSKECLVTIHRGNLPPLNDFAARIYKSASAKEKFMQNGTQDMLAKQLDMLLLYCYPILDHISVDVNNIKQQIFTGNEKKMVAQILFIRRNITDTRKIMQSHKATLEKLLKQHSDVEIIKTHYGIEKKFFYDYENLIDYTKETWDQLESLKEAIEALEETNESLISDKLNYVMKVLTLISVVMLPATFVASLFGMNTEHIPFSGSSYDFWLFSGVTLIASVVLIAILWRKKWF